MGTKKILGLVGSNSQNSINRKLLNYISEHFIKAEVNLQEWDDFDIPIYNVDLERERGIPTKIIGLQQEIDQHDALIIAVSEHNLTISSFFKNIIDWLSRLEFDFLKDKKVLVMSVSNDESGGAHALTYMDQVLPSFGAEVLESFSFSNFSKKFDINENSVTDEILLLGLIDVISNFESRL